MGYIQLRLPKRMKKKIEQSRRNREAQANHEEWLQSQGLDNYTLKKNTKQFLEYYNAKSSILAFQIGSVKAKMDNLITICIS